MVDDTRIVDWQWLVFASLVITLFAVVSLHIAGALAVSQVWSHTSFTSALQNFSLSEAWVGMGIAACSLSVLFGQYYQDRNSKGRVPLTLPLIVLFTLIFFSYFFSKVVTAI